MNRSRGPDAWRWSNVRGKSKAHTNETLALTEVTLYSGKTKVGRTSTLITTSPGTVFQVYSAGVEPEDYTELHLLASCCRVRLTRGTLTEPPMCWKCGKVHGHLARRTQTYLSHAWTDWADGFASNVHRVMKHDGNVDPLALEILVPALERFTLKWDQVALPPKGETLRMELA